MIYAALYDTCLKNRNLLNCPERDSNPQGLLHQILRMCNPAFYIYGVYTEKALVAALTEMYIQGVSTRKVKAISEELCGHSFSASAISGFNKKLDEELGRFSRRQLESEYPYLILDARNEKVRENAVIRSRAVLWPSALIGMADVRCSAWRWPTGRVPQAGKSSFLASRDAACVE